MKNILKIASILLLLLGATQSCQKVDLVSDNVLNTVGTDGAILRTIEYPAEFILLNNPDLNTIQGTVEVQIGNGEGDQSFTEVRVYGAIFSDQEMLNPVQNNDGTATAEALLSTLPASAFEMGPDGLPRGTFSYTTPELVALYPNADLPAPPDPAFIRTRLELVLPDGSIFTNTDVAATIATGSYFKSPFQYVTIFMVN